MQERTILTAADLKLLDELGLGKCGDLESCHDVIMSLRLRQLDKLKIMLSRIVKENSPFSQDVVDGIRKNDLTIFARAVVVLNLRSVRKG